MPPSRRRALHLGAVGLAGALSGCVGGMLGEEDPDEEITNATSTDRTTNSTPTTDVEQTCGVDSVSEYGEGFRAVVWCSAYSNTRRDNTTLHADYFTQYATYFVGAGSTVRQEGEPTE